MIIGLGLDISQMERIEKYLERFGPRFINRVCTANEAREMERFTNPKTLAQNLAGRISAKEAASKALGTGLSGGVHWKCFEVAHEPSGRPVLRSFGVAAQRMAQMGVRNVSLSITHDAGVAAAVVIFEGD
jgi:holo-[acyl-carrier protein] synthase